MRITTPERIDYTAAAPQAMQRLHAIEHYLTTTFLDPKLLNLVGLRASQINGCAYCIDMHSKECRALGEPEQRLYELNARRVAPLYTDRERAALTWTEAVTLIAEDRVPDHVYDEARDEFSEKNLVDLTFAIGLINLWNRQCISFRAVPFAAERVRTQSGREIGK